MSCLEWERSDQRSDHELSPLGALRPRVFSTGSAQTMSFLGWKRSNHEFSHLGALKPRVFSAGSAQTMSFHGWERSDHEFSRLGALKPCIFATGSAEGTNLACLDSILEGSQKPFTKLSFWV